MGLKAIISASEYTDLPAPVQGLYVEQDGQYVIDIDDKDYKSKLNEFRSNNVELLREQEKLKKAMAQYKDVDPEKYRAGLDALTKLEEMQEKELIDAGKLEEVVAQRTERMRQEYDGQVGSLREKLEEIEGAKNKYQSMFSNQVIDSSVIKALSAIKAEVQPGAISDVLNRARSTWQVEEDGALRAVREGKTLYGKDGTNPLTPEEWGAALVKEAPFLFRPSSGGGAQGGSGNGAGDEPGVLAYGDQSAINSNIERIAAGEVRVTAPQEE